LPDLSSIHAVDEPDAFGHGQVSPVGAIFVVDVVGEEYGREDAGLVLAHDMANIQGCIVVAVHVRAVGGGRAVVTEGSVGGLHGAGCMRFEDDEAVVWRKVRKALVGISDGEDGGVGAMPRGRSRAHGTPSRRRVAVEAVERDAPRPSYL
jgi:hypothetical protein